VLNGPRDAAAVMLEAAHHNQDVNGEDEENRNAADPLQPRLHHASGDFDGLQASLKKMDAS
jgi:hypothetical protein